MNTREQLVQSTLREVFHDPTILYDKSHFAGGLTNYNSCVSAESYTLSANPA